MRQIRRPIHSGFETLRVSRVPQEAHFNRAGYPAFEQLTALGLAAPRRQASMFSQGISR